MKFYCDEEKLEGMGKHRETREIWRNNEMDSRFELL
jgi:hypothetical protein